MIRRATGVGAATSWWRVLVAHTTATTTILLQSNLLLLPFFVHVFRHRHRHRHRILGGATDENIFAPLKTFFYVNYSTLIDIDGNRKQKRQLQPVESDEAIGCIKRSTRHCHRRNSDTVCLKIQHLSSTILRGTRGCRDANTRSISLSLARRCCRHSGITSKCII